MLLTVAQAKEFCKENKIKHLDIRSQSSIRVAFKYKSKLYRISLDDVQCTIEGLFQASAKAKEFKNLAKYNPELLLNQEGVSQNALTVAKSQDQIFKHYINEFLSLKQHKLALCTFKNYSKKITKYIVPRFSSEVTNQIKPLDIESWLSRELTHLSNKTIKELLSLLNQILTLALLDDAITVNPMDRLRATKSLSLRTVTHQPDPFSLDEIVRIASAPTERLSEVHMITCNCFMGLRISELLALAWNDIDFENNLVHVNRAVVEGNYKKPKTFSSNRFVVLLPRAKEILLQQFQVSNQLQPKEITVIREDNKSLETQTVNFVFVNTKTGKPYIHDGHFRQRFFKYHLEKAGVRFRGANQTRHTYASHLISSGVPMSWVAQQMGHTSIKMVEKHYAKWLPSQSISAKGMAAKAFA